MGTPAAIPTPEETAFAIKNLETSRDHLLAHCATLQPQDWARSDGPGRWTVAGILEHLIIVERRALGLLNAMLTQPAEPDWHARTAPQDATLPSTAVPEAKIQAPPVLHPQNGTAPAALLADFAATRAATLAFAATPGQPLKEHTRAHPILGPLNGYQWLLLGAYHTERHLKQMQAIPLL